MSQLKLSLRRSYPQRKSAGRPVKRRYETIEDKIRSSQGSKKNKNHKYSQCGIEGHKRETCNIPI